MRFLLLLALLAAPAVAGTRATYTGADDKLLTIEVTDAGDARITREGSDDYGVLIGGVFHVVGSRDGRPMVARMADVGSAMAKVMPRVFAGLFSSAPPADAPAIVADGTETVAGRAGKRYAMRGKDIDRPTTLVVSDDPALKPVGAALEGFMTAAILPMAPLLGAAAGEMVADMHRTFALGTPLRTPTGLTLTGVEAAEVSSDRVKLPAAPQSIDALVADLKASARPLR